MNPMNEYGMTASNVFLYYADVEAATTFYTRTLGFAVAADYGFAKILRVGPSSFITLVDEEMGMHSASRSRRPSPSPSSRTSSTNGGTT